MPIITEVHSISAATDWYVEDMTIASAADLKAIACFALTSTVDPAYQNLGTARMVVAVPESLLGDDLVGKDTADFPQIIHEVTARTVYDWPDRH